jgi:hypothetical protein
MSSRKATSDLWWKNAVVYCLDVESFLDDDGDGCGDLTGLCERTDYLAGLGVSCLWLMPIYPSAQRDDGYDITDYFGVDPRLGTHGDLVELVRTARDRGLRVIADLVPNHTSVEHPWFQAAREGRENPYHEFYVWVDEKPEEKPGDVVFPDQESSNWAYDRKARRWYLHRFYSHQPDLNVANPEVRDEIAQVAGFWLEQGLSGFRLDAVPFLVEPMGMPEGAIPEPHDLLRDVRAFMARRQGESILLGEVNLPPRDAAAFFGARGGEELDLQFAFPVNQALYLALARESAAPLAAALRALPPIPDGCQWAHFVRNHDELTLDKLSDAEREEVFAAFGPEPEQQMYGRGLRRRLRPGADADGLFAHVLSARDAGALLRRGDRDGREPGDRGALRGARADAVVLGGARRVHARGRGADPAAGRRRAVRPSARQRGGAAARPRVAAQLDGAAHPAAARVPRAGLGRVDDPRAGGRGGLRAAGGLGRFGGRGGAQPRGPRRARRARRGGRRDARGPLRQRRPARGRGGRAAPVRAPLVPGAAAGAARGSLTVAPDGVVRCP